MADDYSSRTERKKIQEKQHQRASSQNKNKDSRKMSWKKILYICLTIGLVMFLVGVGALLWIVKDAPKFDETLLKDPLSSQIFASDGKTIIAEVGTEKRDNIQINQIPDVLKNAVLATEDARFYKHHGIDVKRTLVAVWTDITTGSSQGGSTITQQIVKNAFLSTDKTPTRKIQEWYLAIQFERKFSKDQILEMYFNKNLYGSDVYGVAKAAERFFGLGPDELDKLTLEQAALLAGIPQSPNNYIPTVEGNLQAAEKRRNLVLQYMNRHGYLSKAKMESAQRTPIEDTLNIQQKAATKYQAFVDTVITEVQAKTKANIFEDGLKIYSTINPEIQQITENALSTNEYIDYPDNQKLQTAVVILDTQTGAIKAIGGGRNYQTGGFNYATAIKRHPGSTIKPILDYGPAIEKFKWSTGHILKDEQYQYTNGTPIRNANRSYAGNKTIREHLTWSRNIPALKAYQTVGADYATEFANSLGFPISDKQKANEANAIGAIDAASPLNMAGAYAAFGNGGYYSKPYTVSKIIYSDGTEKKLASTKKKVMADYTAFLITDMLRTVVDSGTGTKANLPKLDLAGKTGTTSFDQTAIDKYGLPESATRDAWFVGYTPQYTGAVWTGYTETKSADDYLGSKSADFSKLVFKEIMSRTATSTERFEQPSSVGKSGKEYYVKNGEKPQPPKPNKPTEVQATYDEASDRIQLSWKYSSNSQLETTFEVSYTVDGQTIKLPATSDLQTVLESPVKGKPYVFTVTANTEGVRSESAAASLTVNETAEVPKSPSDLHAQYDQNANHILINWKNNNTKMENIQFIVTYTVNGSKETLTTTAGTSATLSNPQPGQTYVISVVASNETGASGPTTTSVTVPPTENGNNVESGSESGDMKQTQP
ncbi:PBP1A family penicillin-binding protein [Neobacillus sp. OS1-2]|uniref:PBP1A family penicillin-binding protein n=1 Tax=Neobacillus sp. OS1-2 TaxID=3070680 RepID=UPI0027DEDB0A|nr:PBP1A family penicillin-binding protein [Neobacillus sp. OS1-2]WML41778.1 PBP1A family penicillin-binding protein [Neobacillus sp. OS1-2]